MVFRSKRVLGLSGLGILGALAAMSAALATGPAALAGGCAVGETTFAFALPAGVTLKPTLGAVKRGPSKIEMSNCGGNFDPATGAGGLVLEGGVNFKYEGNRGPTGDYRLKFGGVGKLRARVVGKPANIAKISGGNLVPGTDTTSLNNAKLKLTTKGAKLLNEAVDAGDDGPWEAGSLGSVSTTVAN